MNDAELIRAMLKVHGWLRIATVAPDYVWCNGEVYRRDDDGQLKPIFDNAKPGGSNVGDPG
jgi:hypothetical protein